MSAATKPWREPAPKREASTKLSAENIAWARRRAAKAGRRYPNLVDNMAAAARQREQDGTARSRP